MNNSTAPLSPPGSSQPYAAADAANLAALAAALRRDGAEETEPLSCAECRARLPGLYHLLADRSSLDPLTQAALGHLRECAACAAEYAALEEIMGELAAGTLPEPARTPVFDLGFLEAPASAPFAAPSAAAPALWLAAQAAGIRQLFVELPVLLRAAGAAFGALPAALAPQPLAAGTFRAADGRPELLVLPAPDAGISIHLAVGPVVAGAGGPAPTTGSIPENAPMSAPMSAAVMVKLLALPSEQPLAAVRVTLRNAQHQLLMGLVTGPDGSAVFEQLPLGRYFVQVRYEQNTWEIPLVVVGGTGAAP